ncbi:HlyD family efflux transporter periplasmic adaptor subunit [Alienimonas californiensis]|nr:HlyD family efflux transporter periplasmic adaptor subunit [Alienimonas californiensis]
MERPPRPRPAVTLALCGAALLTGTAALALLVPGPPSPAFGTLHAAEDLVRAPRGGRVVRWLVEPGTSVRPETPLVELEDPGRIAELAAADAAVAAAEESLAATERAAKLDLAWRRAAVRRDLHTVRTEAADLLRDRFDAALQAAAEGDALPDGSPRGGVPARTVSLRTRTAAAAAAAANAAEVLEARLALCDLRERELLDLLEELPETVSAAAGVPAAAAALDAANAEREALAAAPATLTLHAPGHGRVGRFAAAPGALADAGEPLTAVRDDARPFVAAQVPTGRLSRFAAGADVTLAFGEGDRRDGYRGRVVSVGPEAGDGLATVRILPTGPLWPDLPEGAVCEVRPAE